MLIYTVDVFLEYGWKRKKNKRELGQHLCILIFVDIVKKSVLMKVLCTF